MTRLALLLVCSSVGVVVGCGGATTSQSGTTSQRTAEMEREAGRICDFPGPDVVPTHEENPTPEARAAYERGLEDTELGDFDRARAAYAEALALDPTFSTASYNLGVTLVRLGRDDEALAAFERTVASDPTSVDALYNIALLRTGRGDHEGALEALTRARSLAPSEFDLTKKIIQSLHALGRFEEAVRERREARRIRACSDRRELLEMTAFIIDQFTVDDETVFVYEVFEPDDQWTIFYAFRVIVGDQAVRSIQLESDPVSREQGVAALFGVGFPDDRHYTTRRAYRTVPAYSEIRETAIELVRASRDGIPADAPASSGPSR